MLRYTQWSVTVYGLLFFFEDLAVEFGDQVFWEFQQKEYRKILFSSLLNDEQCSSNDACFGDSGCMCCERRLWVNHHHPVVEIWMKPQTYEKSCGGITAQN